MSGRVGPEEQRSPSTHAGGLTLDTEVAGGSRQVAQEKSQATARQL